jgi:ABC-type sugar transport system ATPase subunit
MDALLQMININKSFGKVRVLQDMKLNLFAGEVHALLGENGAGKSTLIKILGGIYTKDSGDIIVEGEIAKIHDVESARKYGVSIIHQELMLAPDLTVAENVFIGRELTTKLGTTDVAAMAERTQKLLDSFQLPIRSTVKVGKLNIAQQQMVEIVRAISFGAKIIVMDEPTSSLSGKEVDMLFAAIRKLKESGVGIIYISHRMSELAVVADRVTVLRDGQYIDTVNMCETTHDKLIALMVGRSLENYYSKEENSTDEVILQVKNLHAGKAVRDVSFLLRKGEVLGFAGLVGAGRSETMECLFGLRELGGGEILLDNKPVRISCVDDAIALGFGLVPEDRKKEGIFEAQSVRANTTVEVMDQFLRGGRYDRVKEIELTQKYVDGLFAAKYTSLEQPISALSGGNQQKVIFSRWLLSTKRILILDEPTRGIDVKTKTEIYRTINQLTAQGLAVILVSSELPVLINMSDRIIVMSHGYTTGELKRDEFSQEKIMIYATIEK